MEKADRKIKNNDYAEAVRLLNELLFQYPNSPEADEAAMKNGLILKQVRQYKEARKYFERLISSYPRSPYAGDAKYEILHTLLLEDNNEELIRKAFQFFKPSTDRYFPARVLGIVGDAFLNLNDPENAVKLYTMSFNQSPSSEKPMVLAKIKEGIARFPMEDLESLAENLPDSFPKGYIIFQLGENKIKEGRYHEALTTFKEFMETFPQHTDIEKAKERIRSIKNKAEEELFSIGCLLPLSGKLEPLGRKALTGIELAVSEFGSREDSPRIRIILRDTASDPVRTIEGVRDLAEEKTAAIIGPLAMAEEAAREAQAQQIPMITLTLKNKITDSGDYIFRNFLTAKMQTRGLVNFLTEYLGVSRFAILYPEETYGTALMNLFWDQVVEKGGTIAGAESYPLNLTDYKKPIKNLSGLFDEAGAAILSERLDDLGDIYIQSGAIDLHKELSKAPGNLGAIFIPDSVEKAGMILPQLAYYDISGAYFLGTNLWHSKKFLRMASGYTQNVICTDGFFAESQTAHVRAFVEKYNESFQKTPGFIEAIAYDSAMIVMEALAFSRATNNTSMKEILLNMKDFPGVTGYTSFDATGDAIKGVYILRVKNDQFFELKRPGKLTPKWVFERE